MGEYSYAPTRLGVGKIGQVHHRAAQYHTIKLYTHDAKIAAQHLDALKRAQTRGVSAPKGTVAPQVPNPGNPLQFHNSTEEASVQTETSNVCEECSKTHELQTAFHYDRGLTFLEAAKRHTLLSKAYALGARESNTQKPAYFTGRVPSLYDKHADDSIHDFDKGLEYHSKLHAEATLEANSFAKQANMWRTDLEIEPDPAKQKIITEAIQVCECMSKTYNELAGMHGTYANMYKDYLKRKYTQSPAVTPASGTPPHSPDPASVLMPTDSAAPTV